MGEFHQESALDKPDLKADLNQSDRPLKQKETLKRKKGHYCIEKRIAKGKGNGTTRQGRVARTKKMHRPPNI